MKKLPLFTTTLLFAAILMACGDNSTPTAVSTPVTTVAVKTTANSTTAADPTTTPAPTSRPTTVPTSLAPTNTAPVAPVTTVPPFVAKVTAAALTAAANPATPTPLRVPTVPPAAKNNIALLDLTFSIEGLTDPSTLSQGLVGMAVDSHDNLYLIDAGNYRVVKVSPDGKVLAQWGKHGTNDGEFSFHPTKAVIAVDSNDNVYVHDILTNRIQKFDSNGKFLFKFEPKDTEMPHHPGGVFEYEGDITSMVIDKLGNLYGLEFEFSRLALV